jgi:tRNA-Thr(GGU) m(6)t(6)A37 methyltransferase TsaA
MGADMTGFEVEPIGWVESPLTERAQAPRQGDEGAPDAWLVFEPRVADGLRDIVPGTEIIVLTWLDRADRGVLVTRPRDDPARPPTGVFSTRSPDRPNPIGLHRVQVLAAEGLRIRVRPLEALDKTPVIDLKPVLDPAAER